MRERSEIVVLTIVKTCEARGACLRARKDRDSSFHHWGGAVNLAQAGLSTKRHRESSFQHWGDAVKLVLACLSAGNVRDSSFNYRGVL